MIAFVPDDQWHCIYVDYHRRDEVRDQQKETERTQYIWDLEKSVIAMEKEMQRCPSHRHLKIQIINARKELKQLKGE
jgi:hypothetical protein